MKKGTGTDPSGGGAAMDQVVRLAPEPFYVLSIERIKKVVKSKKNRTTFSSAEYRDVCGSQETVGKKPELFVTTGKWHQIAEQHDTSKHLHLFQFNTFHRKIYSLHQQVVNL